MAYPNLLATKDLLFIVACKVSVLIKQTIGGLTVTLVCLLNLQHPFAYCFCGGCQQNFSVCLPVWFQDDMGWDGSISVLGDGTVPGSQLVLGSGGRLHPCYLFDWSGRMKWDGWNF